MLWGLASSGPLSGGSGPPQSVVGGPLSLVVLDFLWGLYHAGGSMWWDETDRRGGSITRGGIDAAFAKQRKTKNLFEKCLRLCSVVFIPLRAVFGIPTLLGAVLGLEEGKRP